MQAYGAYLDTVEIGNGLDSSLMGWDAFRLAHSFGCIQEEAAYGQLLKKFSSNKDLQIIGGLWSNGWDFSVIDAQARKESRRTLVGRMGWARTA